MAKIIVPTPLRQYAGKQEAVDLSGATVGELLEKLTGEYSDLRRHLYTDDGQLRSFVNVYVNDEDIRYMERENTPVRESDVVSIVPSIAGGKEAKPRMHPSTALPATSLGAGRAGTDEHR